jgi:hypothetical protein
MVFLLAKRLMYLQFATHNFKLALNFKQVNPLIIESMLSKTTYSNIYVKNETT